MYASNHLLACKCSLIRNRKKEKENKFNVIDDGICILMWETGDRRPKSKVENLQEKLCKNWRNSKSSHSRSQLLLDIPFVLLLIECCLVMFVNTVRVRCLLFVRSWNMYIIFFPVSLLPYLSRSPLRPIIPMY